MNKTLLILKSELITTIKRKSFIITLLLIPIAGFIATVLIGNNNQNSGITTLLTDIAAPEEINTIGIIDYSSIIKGIPDEFSDIVLFYKSEEIANQDLNANKIKALYVVSEDYMQSGDIIVYRPDFNPLSTGNDNYIVSNIIKSALLENQPDLADLLLNPPAFTFNISSPETQRDPNSQLTFFIPYIVTFLFYIIILSSASLMLNSVSIEKTNRVIEVLLTSITPKQLLSGKIIALGIVGLVQTIIWTGSGLILLRLSGRSFDLPIAFQLPTSILIWGIIFFILGYLLYASFMAGIGALVPNIREASQATMLIVIPLVIPLALLAPVIENPNGTLAIVLSLFPLTAPVSMMTRLAAGSVPIWESFIAIGLLIISIFWVIQSVSKFFRAQYLLSGKEFKVKYFLNALIGRI